MAIDTDFGYFKRTEAIVVRDDASRAELEVAIAALRVKAERLSRFDPRRDAIDVEVDVLVERWLTAA